MKYKVGDKVLIVDHRVYGMNSDGLMDKWLGKVMTIKTIRPDTGYPYKMEEDATEGIFDDGWVWFDGMIVGKVIGNRVIKNV